MGKIYSPKTCFTGGSNLISSALKLYFVAYLIVFNSECVCMVLGCLFHCFVFIWIIVGLFT